MKMWQIKNSEIAKIQEVQGKLFGVFSSPSCRFGPIPKIAKNSLNKLPTVIFGIDQKPL